MKKILVVCYLETGEISSASWIEAKIVKYSKKLLQSLELSCVVVMNCVFNTPVKLIYFSLGKKFCKFTILAN